MQRIYIALKCIFLLLAFLSLINCGIPGLHKWIIHNFPSCVKIVDKHNLLDASTFTYSNWRSKCRAGGGSSGRGVGSSRSNYGELKGNILEVDNLLFDMNQLLHKANVQFRSYDNYFFKLSSLIKNVLKKFHPKKNVVFAIDGICPFSKLKLQIKRRAKAKSKERNSLYINDITCGSTFIDKISKFLVNFVKYLISFEKFDRVKFFVSTDKEAGEGELKLMNWISNYIGAEQKEEEKEEEKEREEKKDIVESGEKVRVDNHYKGENVNGATFSKTQHLLGCSPGKDEEKGNINTKTNAEEESFVIVGADADLLLQCLALKNIRNIYIYTYQTFHMNIGGYEFKKENHLMEGPNGSYIKKRKNNQLNYSNNLKEYHFNDMLLMDNLNMENKKNKKKRKKKIKVLYNLNTFINLFLNKYPKSFEQIRRDLLILFILKGNDYLPKIKEGNFSLFFESYFKMLEKNMNKQGEEMPYNGFLNKNYVLNRKEFLKFLHYVQDIISFSNYSVNNNSSTNEEECTSINHTNNRYEKEFKENNLYLPLSLLNEILSKNIIENESIKIEIKKEQDITIREANCLHQTNYDHVRQNEKLTPQKDGNNIYRSGESTVLGKSLTCGRRQGNEMDDITSNGTSDRTEITESNEHRDYTFDSDDEKEDAQMELYLRKVYRQNCKNKKNYEQEMKICENYIEGIHWLVEMYTKTYCINFNFFYKYLISPSLLSIYYYLSTFGEVPKYSSDYRNGIQNINLNVFKNNYEYYNFITFCVNKYNDLKMKLKLSSSDNLPNETETNEDTNKIKNEKNPFLLNAQNSKKNVYFENIYDILFSKNVNIVKDNIQKLNKILKTTMHNNKKIIYYWDIYARHLKKFYKIIFYKTRKIYVCKYSLFKLKFENTDQRCSTYKQGLTKKEMTKDNNSNSENDNFEIQNNYFPTFGLNSIMRKNRIFSKNLMSYSDGRTDVTKRVVQIRRVKKIVYR
ncbi:5'-3' exonuclease [Plasmodium brasilianum]|uniref:5'-3' exonuclease n=1 Tax=Plasmodium brasilianum TaxID=5824 RepID=A0ACB9YFD7_PLABR|nr:5'-3' exonuclease [Plasmodium brasilianum]